MKVKIREGVLSDVPGIARVHVDTWRTTYVGIIPQEHLDNLSYRKSEIRWQQFLEGSAEINNTGILVAEDEGKIVGFISYGTARDRTDYRGEVYALYVLEEYQLRGIGKSLLKEAVGKLKKVNINDLLIWVVAENNFRGFYETIGGRPVDEKVIEIGGKGIKVIAYGWEDMNTILER